VAPGVEITTDANNNGFVSSTELNGASTFAVKGTFSNGAVAGDKLVFTAGGVTNTVTLTTADIGVGFATTTFAKPATEGGTLTVTAVIEDAAGNRTPASASDAATLDTTLPNGGAAVGLFIDLDTNNSNIGDGIISSAEKGSAIETSLTATFDRTLVAVGDKVTFSDGTTTKVVTLVQADITAGKVVSTDWALPNEGSTLNVTAVLTDAAGNATPQATDSAKLDTTAPNGGVAPTVSITTDADDNGKVGTSELNGATTFTVQGDFDNTLVFEGDKLVFTAGGVTQTVVLTAQNIRDGFATTTFTAPTNGNALTVNVLVQDAAGNQSPVSDNDTATLDTTTPTLTISHDKTVLLAGQNSTVTFTFSEEVAGFTLDDIDASDAQGSVTGLTQSTQDPKVWTATFTPTANINDTTNVIKVANDVYTDVAGNKGTGDDSDNFEIKTEVPSVTITLADPALKAGETSLVTYTFSQTPTGFEAGDVTISGAKGTLSDPVVTPGTDNKVWTATFTPTTDVEDTTNVISIAAGTYTNSTGVNGTEGTSANFTIDTKAPTLTIAMADSALVVGETSKVTFTFSEAPTGFTAADVTVPSGIGAISGLAATSNPLVWEALFTPATNVAYTANIISVAASTYTDAAGNNGGAAETANFTIDTTVPTVTVEMGKSALKGGETTTVTFTFSQTPTGFDVADVDMTGAKGALSNLVQDPNNSKVWTATFTPTAQIEDATNIIKVKAESYTNASGNKGTEGVSANFTIDTLPPSTTITIDTIDDNQGTTTGTVASGGVTDDTTPTVKGTLGTALATGETVHIFDNGVDIGTATISVGSTAFTFNDTRTSIVDGSNLKYTAKVFDAAGNSGTASNLYTATITTTVPTITVTSVALDTIDATHLNGLFDTSERAALIGSATLPIISGTTTNVDVGQTVSVTLNGHTYTGTVAGTKASGTWSISVTEADALLLNHGNTYDISATVSDAAGQTATDTDNKLEVKVGELDIPTVVDNKTNSHTPTLTGVSQKLVSGSPVALDTNDILEITIKNPDGTIAKAISATIGGTLPTGFTYTASTKTWSYDTAAAGLNLADGTYEIIVLATDAVPNPDVQKADISTSELIIDSTAPVFSSGASVDVAENIDISVAANAVVYTAAASDSTTGNHGATFSLKSGGDAAKFSIDATTGKVSIKESPNFEDAANTDHQYSFTVEAIDTFGNKSEKAVTVNVTNVNEAPVAVADTVDATEAGGTANGTAGTNPIGNALTNDTDVDANDTKTVKDIKASSAASVTAVNASTTSADGTEVTGSFGKLKIGADGSYVYTVDNTNATVQALNTSSTALQDVFSYTVKDAAGLTSTANITVSVKGANDAPTVATAIADTTGTVGTAFANFVLPANTFADVDDSTLTLSATLADGTALPSWLTFNASTRTFSATPNATPDTTGTVSVKVTATDGGSLTATDTFDIVVGAANAAPVANPTTVNNAFGPSQAPEVTITDNQSAAYVANGTELTYTLKFSKAINAASLTASDLKLTGQDTTFASVLTKVDDTTWTYTAKAAASGSTPMVLSMADATYTSTTGEQGLGGSDVQGVGTAPGPVPGTGTQVNTKNLGLMYSFDNAIETLSDGGWVATYYVSGVGGGTYAQRYNADGSTNGGEISVVPSTTATGGIGGAATVSALPNGGFVVASSDQNNTYYRIYDASNTASSTTPLKLTGKAGADVLALNDGTFVMTVTNASGAANGNFLYHFDSAGAQIGSAVPIDSAALPISSGWLTKLANGNFVYTWTATASGTGETQDIYMQLFDATGAKVGNFTRANTTVAGIQYEPSVADLENGGYVVSWRSGTTANSLVMRIFDASGNAVGNEITVASVSSGSKSVSNATVEGLVGGGFVVTYDNTSDSANFYVQVYDDAGATVGSPVKVADDPLNAARPVATALSNGGFVVEYRTKNAAGTVATYQTIFGPTGAVVATGTAAADTLTGNDKADTITGAGGADIIYAGSGDDKVILNTDNVTKLADAAAATMVVDGGTGVNTLQITNSAAGTGATLDLNSATVAAKLKGFSSIDITGPAATANTLKLDYKAISTLSGTTDNAATTAANESKMLVVSGDAGDTVELVDKASWNVGSSQSAASLTALYGKSYNFVTGHTYKAYTLNGATLFVDDAVTLNTLAASTGGAGTTAVAVTEAKTVQQLFGPSFSDTDSGQVFKGVAITSAGTSAQVSAAGAHYEWSADGGTTWTALAAGLTDSTAVFLEPTALIRFAAAAGSAVAVPTADLKAHLVDTSGLTNTTSLVSGNTTDASLNGGSTAFSDVPVVVSLLNRAPEVPVGQTSVVDPFGVGVISRTGTFVIDGSSATVTSGGQTVATIAVSSTSTALQSTDATRLYVPKGVSIGEKSTFVETDTFTFTNPQAEVVIKWAGFNINSIIGSFISIKVNGVDHVFSASDVVEVGQNGTATITTPLTPVFSTDGLKFIDVVEPTTNSVVAGTFRITPPAGSTGINTLEISVKDDAAGITATLSASQSISFMTPALSVATLFGGTHFGDADVLDKLKGVVITNAGAAADITGKGKYQFSTDNGTTWTDLAGGLTDATGVYLKSTDLVRFQSVGNTATAIKQNLVAHLVDTSTASSTFTTSGATVDVSGANSGGSTAVSSAAITIAGSTAPVVLDLNHDGVLAYSQVQMDVNGDGVLDQTAWAAAQDGVLVWDKYADGKVHNNSQYAFAQYGAAGSTDLQGLAAGFDSNADGVFNAQDAKFAQFAVWQDANQNGVADAGEVRKLSDVGVTAINLTSDGVVRVPNAQVVEAGHSTAQLTDGSTMVVADAEFGVQALSYHIDTTAPDATKLVLTGAGMDLNLSTFAAKHGAIAEVDVSGTGANSIKLTLADLLQGTPNATLKITGDADDSVNLDVAAWTNTGNTVAQNGHTYAVYNDVSSHTAQLLIDQNLVNAGHVI
jgi:VCBS repeat-containing protein